MPDDELPNKRDWVWDLEDAFRDNIGQIVATTLAIAAILPLGLVAESAAGRLGVAWFRHPEEFKRATVAGVIGLYTVGLTAGYLIASIDS